jgi:uncharacterized membrane protein
LPPKYSCAVGRSNFNVAVDIDAPPDRVFAVLRDVERWPEWTPSMTRVQRLDRGPFSIGSRALVRQPKLRPAVWQVTELEEHRNFTWIMRTPGLRMQAEHLIEPRGAGSRALLSFELSGLIAPLISRLYGGLIQQYISTESRGLKQRAEAAP